MRSTDTTLMRSARRLGVTAVAVGAVAVASVLSGSAASAATPAAKKGGVCSKAWTTSGSGSSALVCTKTPKGLRWALAPVAPAKKVTGASTTTTRPSAKPGSTTLARSAPDTTSVATSDTGPVASTRSGALRGVGEYRSAGRVELRTTGGQAELHLIGANIQSGPALAVYVTTTPGALKVDGAVRLGPLTALTGDQTYRLPAGTDPATIRSVLIWCDRFAVAFGAADLA